VNNNRRSVLAAGLVLMALMGCTSLESVPVNRSKPEDLRAQLAVGETVIVRLHNGDQRQFRIVALENDAIVGRDERIAFRDIDVIDVKYVDYMGTVQATGAVALLALVYIGRAWLDEGEDDSLTAAPCRTDGSGGMICKPK
jgi:hypothetical protein